MAPKEDLDLVSSAPDPTHDDVFGEITEEGPNFRNVGFTGTVILMMKTQIGLGVLAIPSALDVLGMVPGVLCMIAIAVVTTWSGYMVGAFKLNHRAVYSIDDAGGIMFGLPGRAYLSAAFCLYYIFNSGSAILGISIGLNAVSTHATCTAVFAAVAAIAGFGLSSIRTLGRITWLAWIGLPCILAAIIIVTIAVGIQDRPASAAQTEGPWSSDWKVIGHPSFAQGIAAVSNLLFAFSGTPGFFSIVSEMRDPRQYTGAMLTCQTGVTAVYAVIGCVIYYYCGSHVSSPALGSAGGAIKIISYAFALPGLLVTMTIVTHIPAKFIFVHALRGSRHLTSNTLIHWTTWISCTLGITVIAYIIASTIPVFDALVSLIGALLGPAMCIQPMGAMWLYDNWARGREGGRSKRWVAMVVWSVFVIVIGTFMMVAGTYGVNRPVFYFANAALSISTDFATVLVPVPWLRRLQMPLRQKIAVGCILAMGCFVGVVSCIRLASLYTLLMDDDLTWNTVNALLWCVIELNLGITGGCVTAMRPFVRRYFPRLLGLSSHSIGSRYTYQSGANSHPLQSLPHSGQQVSSNQGHGHQYSITFKSGADNSSEEHILSGPTQAKELDGIIRTVEFDVKDSGSRS